MAANFVRCNADGDVPPAIVSFAFDAEHASAAPTVPFQLLPGPGILHSSFDDQRLVTENEGNCFPNAFTFKTRDNRKSGKTRDSAQATGCH